MITISSWAHTAQVLPPVVGNMEIKLMRLLIHNHVIRSLSTLLNLNLVNLVNLLKTRFTIPKTGGKTLCAVCAHHEMDIMNYHDFIYLAI